MKYIKEISLIIALIVGLLISDFNDLIGILGLIGLLAGFLNVYFTTRRSELFIAPHMVWIACTLASLLLTKNYTDIPLYIFYIFIGFVQYFNWKRNKIDNKVEIDYNNKISYWILAVVMLIMFGIFGTVTKSNNILLGATVSSFGIMGAYLLSQRKYISEYMFLLSNISNIFLLVMAQLYQLALIPTIFLWFSLIFLWENRKSQVVNEVEKEIIS